MAISALSYAATGNQSAKAMVDANGNVPTMSPSGILTDVYIDLTGATSAVVQINDAIGIIFGPTSAVVADTAYKIDDAAIKRNATNGPLTVTTSSVSGGDTTLTVRAFIKS